MNARMNMDIQQTIAALANSYVLPIVTPYIQNYATFIRIFDENSSPPGNFEALANLINYCGKSNANQAHGLAIAAKKYYGQKLLTHPTGGWLLFLEDPKILIEDIVDPLTEKAVIEFLLTPNEIGETILHIALSKEMLFYIISKALEVNRYDVFSQCVHNRLTPLERLDIPDAAFEKMLMGIPEEQRYAVVMRPNERGNNLLAHYWDDTNRLPIVLNAIPENIRLSVITQMLFFSSRQWGINKREIYSVIQRVANKLDPLLLRVVLSTLPREERLPALMHDSAKNASLSSLSKFGVQSIHDIFQLLPEEHLRAIVSSLLLFNESELVNYLKFLTILPPLDRLSAIQARAPEAFELRPYFTHTSLYGISCIIEEIPPEHRFDFLNTKFSHDETLLTSGIMHSSYSTKGFIATCLELLSETEGFSLLFTTVGNLSLLQHFTLDIDHLNVPFQSWWDKLQSKYLKNTTHFMRDFITIASFLQYEYNQYKGSSGFISRLFYSSEAGNLLAKFKQCHTVDECKQMLLIYLEQPDTMYGKRILSCMAGDGPVLSLEDQINAIAKCWNTVYVPYWLGESPEML